MSPSELCVASAPHRCEIGVAAPMSLASFESAAIKKVSRFGLGRKGSNMRKISAIALATMMGFATPVFMSESASAQAYSNEDSGGVSPFVWAGGAALLALLIFLIADHHHHHQVSP